MDNILDYTGEVREKSGFQKDSTFLTGKGNIVSLADEREWKELSNQLVQDEADGIAEIIIQVLQKRKERRNSASARIIPFEKRA